MAKQFSVNIAEAFARAMKVWDEGNAAEARRMAQALAAPITCWA